MTLFKEQRGLKWQKKIITEWQLIERVSNDVSFERLKKQRKFCIMRVRNFPKSESISS